MHGTQQIQRTSKSRAPRCEREPERWVTQTGRRLTERERQAARRNARNRKHMEAA